MTYRSDFPLLGSQGSWGSKITQTKGGTPGKTLNRQKSSGGGPGEYTISSSPTSSQPSLRGKKDALTKHSGRSLLERVCFLFSFLKKNRENEPVSFTILLQRQWTLRNGVRTSASDLLGQKVCISCSF